MYAASGSCALGNDKSGAVNTSADIITEGGVTDILRSLVVTWHRLVTASMPPRMCNWAGLNRCCQRGECLKSH